MSHLCPAPGCEIDVPTDQYACRAHWYSLPKPLRDEIWRTYNRQPQSDDHLAAMDRATAWLHEHARA